MASSFISGNDPLLIQLSMVNWNSLLMSEVCLIEGWVWNLEMEKVNKKSQIQQPCQKAFVGILWFPLSQCDSIFFSLVLVHTCTWNNIPLLLWCNFHYCSRFNTYRTMNTLITYVHSHAHTNSHERDSLGLIFNFHFLFSSLHFYDSLFQLSVLCSWKVFVIRFFGKHNHRTRLPCVETCFQILCCSTWQSLPGWQYDTV